MWAPGDRFGELEIERELGRGAFGSVYLAKDTLVGRHVALKVLRLPGSGPAEEERAALLREAQLVGRLKSPHVATLYRVHPMPDGWVFELEYVEGGSLDDRLSRQARLPAHEASRIIAGVLRGLADAHERGVIHGDVKPGNVLLGPGGSVKLVDFGLAQFVGGMSLRLPRAEVVGTPAYMAPEVIMGEPPGAAADLWSAGVVLYRMLSGRMPFPGRSLGSLLPAILNLPPAPLDPEIPAHLVDVAMRCLAKSPRERPASCAEAIHDLRPGAVAEPRPAPQPDRPTSLVGRAAERARLHAAVDRAAGGSATAVLVTGDLGMGKSALAADLMAHASARGFRWAEARVTAIEGLLRPLLASLRDMLAQPEDADANEIESRLFGTATNLLRTLLEERAMALDSRQQIAWGLEELLNGLARDRPLGVLVEDAHLANAEDWKLLEELDRRLPSGRILLCIVAGTEPGTPLPLASREGVEHVQVGPLDTDAIVRLLHDRSDGARVAPEILRRVFGAAEGNPLFAIELFRHLRDSGAVVQRGGDLVAGPGFARAALPRRLRELARVRLRSLAEEQRALLDIAAVDGVAFDGENVAAAAGRPLLDVLRALQEICRRTGLVTPQTHGYRFAHGLLQEAIYDELAPALRRALHAKIAETLEAQVEMKRPVAAARLALHWEGAGEPERAREYLVTAALEAVKRQEQLRALDFAERAGLAPDRLDAETAGRRADVLLELIGPYGTLGRTSDAETILDRLDEAATASGDAELSRRVLIARSRIRYDTRGLVGFDKEALKQAAETVQDRTSRSRALYLLGRIAKYRGALDEAEQWFGRADRIATENEDMGLHSSALDQLGSLALRRGRWRHAEALYGDAARISGVAGRRTNAAVSEVNAVYAAYSRGALEGLDARLAKAIRTFLVEGAEVHAAHARVHVAKLRYACGDLKGALESVQEALPPLRKARYLRGLISATAERAHLAAVAGSLDVARQGLAESRRLAQLAEDDVSLSEVETLACSTACFFGDRPGAIAVAREAIAIAGRVQELPPRAEALLSLSRAVVYGLPWAPVRGADALVAGAGPEEAELVEVPLALHRAAASYSVPDGDPGPLLEAAEILGSDRVGPHRASLRALADVLEAEALRRKGDLKAAAHVAYTGISKAALLGHVWLEAKLLLLRGGLPDGTAQAARLRELSRRLSAGLEPEETRLMLEAWAPGVA